jgi:hypothetical protein
MRKLLAAGLGGLLLWQGMAAWADDLCWRPAEPLPRVSLGRPVADTQPLATLGLPLPLVDGADSPAGSQVARYAPPAAEDGAARFVVRAQNTDLPPPPPPPDAGLPPSGAPRGDERYNCGVVTENPGPGHPIWDGGRKFLAGIPWPWTAGPCPAPAGGRCLFQSDHCFDTFISPVTNPFLFEDPRALTEVRPIFIWQTTPNSNPLFKGGDLEFFGVQARVALTERWSIVMSKLGFLAIQPNGSPNETGFSEINVGPKFTFLRNDATNTLGALGVTFQIPAGDSKVFQNTGDLSITPYLSLAQKFCCSSYGAFNAMGTVGYSFATDSVRTDYLFTSLHLDYDVANLHRIYPLLELNWFHYTGGGHGPVPPGFGFEGRDLFNFGNPGVTGKDDLAIAVGARYKFSECIQTGIAAEFPLISAHSLLDFRLTFDLIFRY